MEPQYGLLDNIFMSLLTRFLLPEINLMAAFGKVEQGVGTNGVGMLNLLKQSKRGQKIGE
jgi:hypothetical protein